MYLKSIKSRLRVPLGWAVMLASLAVLPARADYQSTVVDQGPVGYWRLNETTAPVANGTTANLGSLGSSAMGTYVGSPTHHLPGPFTGSLAVGFDGSSQYVSTPWVTGLNTSTFSIELWVNPAQVPKFAYIASSAQLTSPRSGWYLAQDDGSTFGFGSAFVFRTFAQNGTTPAWTVATPVPPAGTWTHLVITYDGTIGAMYTNGSLAMSVTNSSYVANVDALFTVGIRSSLNFPWPGEVAEEAAYSGALSAAQVAAHYTAATTAPSSYATTVLADSPVLYYRFPEAADVAAANIGTLGSAATGKYPVGTTPGAAGPRQPTYPGFEANNYAVTVPGTGPSVSVPALHLNTNAVTITAWIKPSAFPPFAGVVMCDAGTTPATGLNLDPNGTGIGYTWNNDANTYNWIPSTDSGLPLLQSGVWSFVALVVDPNQAAIYLCDANNAANFTGVTNSPPGGHTPAKFDGATLFGSDANAAAYAFAGGIDEVAIFNRALGKGEVYSQYATAVGGLKPLIFGDLQGPIGPVAAGDPIVLVVDAGGTPPLTYTWHRSGTNYAITSTGTLTIANSTLSDQNTYDVRISSSLGSTNSQSVFVQVVTPSVPQIDQLLGYQSRTLYPTGTLSFAVSATGGGLKYQWYKNASPIASATASAYTVASVTTGNAGRYSLSISNAVGTATSGPPVVITIPSVTAGSYEAAMVASAPEAWWRLDEVPGSTNMFDGMGRHDGAYTNAAGSGSLPTLGVPGALINDTNTAASFSSTGQGIGLVPFSPTLNAGQQTIEAWVKTSVLNGQVPVSSSYGTGGNWMQSIDGWWYGDCSSGYWGNNLFLNTNASIIPGYWSYIVLIYDPVGSSAYPNKLFVNGTTDGYIWGAAPVNTGGPFIIGGRGVSAATLVDRLFDGQVDEVAVYQRVLSGAEMAAHLAARGIVIIPATFTKPLLSQTVTTGKNISFTTSVLGTAPVLLQWYKDGTLISGANTATYTIASTAVGDSGSYTLWATNAGATNSLSASLTVIPPVSYANVTNGLVLHLRFDGDTVDSSGHGNDGTGSSSPAPAFVPGIIGAQALQYTTLTNGLTNVVVTSASYVTLGTVGSGPPADLQFGASTSFSVGLWVKVATNDLQGDLPYIGTATNSNNNPGWDLSPSYRLGGWQWNLNDGVKTPGNNVNVSGPDSSINDGNWHNFVVTVDRTAKVANSYLDGVHTASQSISSLGNIDNNNYWPIVIGQDPTLAYPEAGSATMDDVGIWRRALTSLEVANIASAGSTGGRSFDTVGPIPIAIAQSGGRLILNYGAGTLLESTTLGPSASWTPVPGASAPSYTVTPSGTGKYYRVLVQ